MQNIEIHPAVLTEPRKGSILEIAGRPKGLPFLYVKAFLGKKNSARRREVLYK